MKVDKWSHASNSDRDKGKFTMDIILEMLVEAKTYQEVILIGGPIIQKETHKIKHNIPFLLESSINEPYGYKDSLRNVKYSLIRHRRKIPFRDNLQELWNSRAPTFDGEVKYNR